MELTDNIKKHFPQEVLKRYEIAIALFMEKSFSIKDTGSTSRVIAHWYKKGILGNGNEIRQKRKFSLIEYCWIKIVMEMRSFNIEFYVIHEIKKELMRVINMQEIKEFSPEGFDIAKELAKTNDENLDDFDIEDEETQEILQEVNYTFLYWFIIHAVASRDSMRLLIDCNGKYYVLIEKLLEEYLKDPDFEKFYSGSYISISINSIIRDLITKIDAMGSSRNKEKQERLKGVLLTKEERKVLELIRKNEFKEVQVLFNDETLTKTIKVSEIIGTDEIDKFIDYIYSKVYTEIVLTTKKDKKVHLKRL